MYMTIVQYISLWWKQDVEKFPMVTNVYLFIVPDSSQEIGKTFALLQYRKVANIL